MSKVPDKYRGIVGAGAKAAGAIGVPGAFSFGLDVTVMGVIWTSMVLAIAEKSQHKVDKAFAIKLTTGVLAGVAAYVGGSKLAMKLLHLIPVAGSLAAIGVNSSLNYLFTYKFGNAMAKLFDKGTFDTSDTQEVIITLLTLVAAIPAVDEVGDMIQLASEPLDRKTFDEFMAAVSAERARRGL
jgi:uncharacterized protein (DUF697 family)